MPSAHCAAQPLAPPPPQSTSVSAPSFSLLAQRSVGDSVGDADGVGVGDVLGPAVGDSDGEAVGLVEGRAVGTGEHQQKRYWFTLGTAAHVAAVAELTASEYEVWHNVSFGTFLSVTVMCGEA